MGSALTAPAAGNGHAVARWGTHLDGHRVAAVRKGEPHPKLEIAYGSKDVGTELRQVCWEFLPHPTRR